MSQGRNSGNVQGGLYAPECRYILPQFQYVYMHAQVEVLSILKHPNIIAYFDNFVEEKSLMIVMEYAPGGTLFEFIQDRSGVLMEEEVD